MKTLWVGRPHKHPPRGVSRVIKKQAFANLETTPQVQLDYEKFAKLAGMTDGSARVTWGRIRRKLTMAANGEDTPGSANSATGTPKPKAKKGGRKRKTGDAGDAEADTVTSPKSPTDMVLERRKNAKNEPQGGVSTVGNDDGVKIKGEDGV